MHVVVTMLCGTLALALAQRPADACEALEAEQPTEAQLEACLKARPFITSSVGGSLAVGGDTGARGGLFVTADIPVLRPVWLSARAHMGSSYSDFDLLAGWVLLSRYGAGRQTFTLMSNTYHSPTATGYSYTTTYTAHSANVVQRGALLLLAGLKGVRRTISGEMESSLDFGKTYEVGLAYHHANHLGSHSRVEAFVVTRGGKVGSIVTWHNSVPSMGRWVVGMEAGWFPVAAANDETTHTFYWNIVDLGISFEL